MTSLSWRCAEHICRRGRSRTYDQRLRSPQLYPSELHAQNYYKAFQGTFAKDDASSDGVGFYIHKTNPHPPLPQSLEHQAPDLRWPGGSPRRQHQHAPLGLSIFPRCGCARA